MYNETDVDFIHAVIVHAHCYQPPREDPWMEVVDVEPSAAPDHDWNSRITRECYARLGAAEVRVAPIRPEEDFSHENIGSAQSAELSASFREIGPPPAPDAPGGLARVVNCYAWCTFDVGATLCEWLEKEAPDTYRAMLDGDRAGAARLNGHGNAIAAPYHHIILPLASKRDKITEVKWGIEDFTRRFGRKPRGFWLPETAVDKESLEVIADAGIEFTILAPYQVRNPDPNGRPLRWKSSSGNELAIFTYDGALAGEVAFGGLLRDPAAFASRLAPSHSRATQSATVLATDGETFGHHHRGGEVSLARAIARIAARQDARIHNFSSLLSIWPPIADAQLVEPSSWSCAHGVERWQSDCGCKLDPSAATSQAWRTPLRRALKWLAGEVHSIYSIEASPLFTRDVWDVRDDYGSVVALDNEALASWVRSEMNSDAAGDENSFIRARELLEMERATLRLFTSCAWFFDDVARIETRQVLRYAARVLELSNRSGRLEAGLLERLGDAKSNDPRAGTAADVFVRGALPHRSVEGRIAAAAAALDSQGILFDTLGSPAELGAYDILVENKDSAEREPSNLNIKISIRHKRTGRVTLFDCTTLPALHKAALPRVSVRPVHKNQLKTPELFDVRDFPECAALALLRPLALTPFPDPPFTSFEPR